MNIILCGLPRCGKTTIGKKLALELQLPFIDTDRLVEEMYKEKKGISLNCQSIYQIEGNVFFRQIESDAILSLNEKSAFVISSGGGSVLNKDNCTYLKQLGRVVYLNQNPKLIWKRLLDEKKIMFLKTQTEEAFYELVNERIPLYEFIADATLQIEHKKVEEIVSEIITLTKK